MKPDRAPRRSSIRVLFCLTVLMVLHGSHGYSQTGAPACFGDLATVRVSLIKPGGTIQGFMKAVEAHKAWYRANGVNENDIVAARMLVKDEKTGLPGTKYSDTEIMVIHLRPPAAARTPNKNDAGWQAFLKQYKDHSDLKHEYFACVPRLQY